jgi:hypothetical protein
MQVPMRTTRLSVGLYGLLFHAAVVGIAAWVGQRNQAGIPARFWLEAAPPFLAAAFAVYAVVVAPYVPRRATTRGAVLFDSVVGMLAETAVFVLAALLHGAAAAAPAARGGLGAWASAWAATSAFAILWAFGSFFLQILVVGNAAGLVGWWVLKRLAARAAAAPAER